ncbi:site-2 protease family protein [Lacipirellula limnantheis]|uniref:Peptidase family M50 n=1 Tax=Lacipirellula limnantheis TaxID=2528024 RepID=A0A517TV47_9BACT|nr:site-2 protease family protein [Lacipirellula limnantheis]QDT72249.1 Peptidase family M50 [Lacipirellula limnantheis]
MNRSAAGSWSFSLGRWRGVELRLHAHFPLLALAVIWLAQVSSSVAGDVSGADPLTVRNALIALAILFASVLIHEAVRALVARRVGGRTNLIVLGPTGGWSQPHLPSDPPAHLVTGIAGPLTYLAIVVTAACCLAAAGKDNLLHLFSPFQPVFQDHDSLGLLIAQLTVWINTWLLLVNLLPVQPCDGAEILRSVLWPLVGRASASAASAHIAYGAAAVAAILAITFQHQDFVPGIVPKWFPLAVVSVLLLYGGNRAARQRQYDVGLDIDQWESDDEQWISADWIDDDRTAVLVEHLHQKQQDVLDRKRREREDREDARVDDILARMHEVGFDQLSDEEQAVLKRASRRYRQRQQRVEDVHGRPGAI